MEQDALMIQANVWLVWLHLPARWLAARVLIVSAPHPGSRYDSDCGYTSLAVHADRVSAIILSPLRWLTQVPDNDGSPCRHENVLAQAGCFMPLGYEVGICIRELVHYIE